MIKLLQFWTRFLWKNNSKKAYCWRVVPGNIQFLKIFISMKELKTPPQADFKAFAGVIAQRRWAKDAISQSNPYCFTETFSFRYSEECNLSVFITRVLVLLSYQNGCGEIYNVTLTLTSTKYVDQYITGSLWTFF